MAEHNTDHERRISTIEGEMKSLATKADLAEFKADIMEYVQAAMRAQTEEFRATFDKFSDAMQLQSDKFSDALKQQSDAMQLQSDKFSEALEQQSDKFSDALERQSGKFSEALDRQGGEIRKLREKESRFKGAVDTLKYALPFLISVVAVLVAVLK